MTLVYHRDQRYNDRLGVDKSPAGRLFGTAEDPQKAGRIAAAR